MMKNKKQSFFRKYKWWFIIAAIIAIVGYIIVYLCFIGNGCLSAGIDLEKKDWLTFLGSYLTFVGTVAVSAVAILQSHYYAEQQKLRDTEERKKQIQPIFSVEIVDIDSKIAGTAEAFNPSNPATYPKHQNVTLKIENVADKPIRNVIIFDKYLYQLLKPNEQKTIQLAYSDSPDIQKWKKHLLELLESEYERNDKGIPKWFNICYDDVDGHSMFQSFELKNFDGTDYYSLETTEEA
jgi:uncharacterized membrane protein